MRELTKKGESLSQVKGEPKVYDMKVIRPSGFQHVFSANGTQVNCHAGRELACLDNLEKLLFNLFPKAILCFFSSGEDSAFFEHISLFLTSLTLH